LFIAPANKYALEYSTNPPRDIITWAWAKEERRNGLSNGARRWNFFKQDP
jgi:hypothetical protein